MVRRIAAVERELLEPPGHEDRKRAEEALREGEERLRTIVSSAPIILFALDGEGVFTLSEGKGLDVLGLKPGEVVGRSVFDVFPEVPQIPREFRRALAGEAFNSILDVAGVTLESWYHPLRDPNGEVTGVIGLSMDITERKQAEEALRESEEKYRRLVQDSTDGIVIVEGLELKFVNRALLKMYGGKSEKDMVGRPLTEFVAPEDRELMVERTYARGKGQNVPTHYEFRALRKDGTKFDAELSVSVITYEGRVARQGVIRDITEHKRMEEALRESGARYRLLAENTSDLIWTMDLGLRYTYMSPAITRMRGYSVEEIVGTTIQETMTPVSLEVAREALTEEMAAERTGQADPSRSRKIELEMYCKDGSTIWTEMNMTFLRDSDGRPIGILGVTRDVTERKRAETALRTMNSAIASSINAIALAHLDGNLTYVNPSLVKMWGYDDEKQLLGRPVHQFWQTRERALEVGKALRDKRGWTGELVASKRDGSTFDVEMLASMVTDEAGKPICIMGSFLDISERKRAEEERRQADQRYRELFEEAPAMYLICRNENGAPIVADCNELFLSTLGYTRAEVVGRPITDFYTAQSRAELLEGGGFQRALAGLFVPEERQLLTREGRIVETVLHATPELDVNGQVLGTRAMYVDITQRKQAEQALEESERRHRLLAENVSDVIFTTDMNMRYTYVSPSITRMRGYSVEEVMASTLADSLTPASLEVARKVLVEELAREKAGKEDLSRARTVEVELYRKDGSTFWSEVTVTFLRDPDGQPFGLLGISRDISERKRAEEERKRLHAELQARAITDSLTGLYNHAHFYERLAEETDRSKRYSHRFALVMMDVDAFKHYNDARGHQAGDEALRLVGECIRSPMRRSDLAFRYGGDEFAAILQNADASKARAIVSRINKRIATSLEEMSDPAAEWLGLSAGIACFPEHARTIDELVKMADEALYNAKRLAWARGVMVQGQAIESPFLPLHETQSGMLSVAASSLGAALEDLGASEVVEQPDLRTIAAVGAAAEIKDPYIRGHQERISRWAATIAGQMGLSPERVRNIRIAGLLHDLGKVGIHDGILNKPGKLTEEEFTKIKEHPALGAMMIIAKAEALQALAPIVRHHHERFDGDGYPDGLAREHIPLEARILSVVDVFDAMTHERAYRKALPKEEAIAELKRGAGTQFDPRVVKAFLALESQRFQESVVPVEATSEDGRLPAVRASGGDSNRQLSGSDRR